MAHYTIFELERIEKVLQAKLYSAREAYMEKEAVVRKDFITKYRESTGIVNLTVDEAHLLNGEWEKHKLQHMDLMLLSGEVDLFERGINALYSYWNSSVEIFIDNMREKAEKEKPRYAINQDPEGDVRYP